MRIYLSIELAGLIQISFDPIRAQVYEVLIAPSVENEYVLLPNTYDSFPRVFL